MTMPAPLASPGITEETIDLIRMSRSADVTRSGITTQSGLQGYELEAPAKVIVPIVTPLINMIPRKMGSGNPICHWIAITSFDTARSVGVLTEGALPTAVTYQTAPMQNPYKSIALSNSVTFDEQWTGRSLEGDVRARRVGELLYQLKTREEFWVLNASQLLMVPATPLVSTATTGGSVAAGTYFVVVTAKNGNGETTMSGAASITTTGTTSTITVTIFTVPNATQYNVYMGTSNARTSLFIQSSISGANAPQPSYNTVISLNGGGAQVSGDGAVGPTITVTLTAAVAGSGANPPATNGANSFVDPNTGALQMWDGIIAQALLNTSTSNGLTLGSQVVQPATTTGNSAGVAQLSDIDNMLGNLYSQAVGDPDFLVMHPIMAGHLTSLVIAAGQTRYVVEAAQPGVQGKLTAQYRVTHYLNKYSGKEMPIIVDRYCPVDTLVALPMTIPFPVNDIGNAIEIETNREYWGVDFAITDSSYKFADYVNETLKVYFLGGLGVLRGCIPAA